MILIQNKGRSRRLHYSIAKKKTIRREGKKETTVETELQIDEIREENRKKKKKADERGVDQ